MKRKAMPLENSPKNEETVMDPQNSTANGWALWHKDSPWLRAILATALSDKTTKEIVTGFP